MSIVCVAIIGKANNPLYIKSVVNHDDPLKFHYISHTALDIIEEKVATKKAAANQPDMYLGLLYPTEDYKVYGYITNTKIKLIVVVDDSLAEVKETELRTFFKQFHAYFIDMVMNPFYIPDEKVESKRFEKKITSLISSFTK